MATRVEERRDASPAQIDDALAQLAASQPPPQEFFDRFLTLVAARIGALGGEAWGLSRQGLLAKICRTAASELLPDDASTAKRRLQRLLQTLHSGRPSIHSPPTSHEGAVTAECPSLLAPLLHRNQCIGVVEVFFPAETSRETAQSQLDVLCKLIGHASRYVAGLHAAEPVADQLEYLRRLEQTSLRLHGLTSSREVAQTAANEGRRLLGCDRLGVAVRRGNRAELLAISGQERIVQRSNLVRAMTQIASQALVAGRPIRYSGSLEGLPPQVEQPLVEYLAESGARSLWCLPLRPPQRLEDDDRPSTAPPQEAIGVLLVEHLGETDVTSLEARVEQFAAHVAQALSTSCEQERVFLLPLRRTLGRLLAWAARDGKSKCILAAGIAASLLAILALVPMPYRAEAEGRLLPAVQRRVFAPHDGEVVEVYVRDGQRVEVGQPLVRLRNDELAIRMLTARNELSERQQLHAALEAQEAEARRTASPADQVRLRGRISQTAIEIEGLRQQLAALASQQAELVVKADIRGVIATFQPQELLVGRPVERGQLLVEVMDPDGPWQIELEMPGHRLGRIFDARHSQGVDGLPVEFVLATAPEQTCRARLTNLATRAAIGETGASTIPLIAAVDGSSISQPTVGAEVVARVDCGRTSVFYALFGDSIEFVRLHVW